MENEFTRPIGDIFEVVDDGRRVLLQVCEERIPRGGSVECSGCYLRHYKTEKGEYFNSKTLKVLDCWKFKLHSYAGECWSAFRDDGTHVVFKKIDDDENKDS